MENDPKGCPYCKELNEEEQPIMVTEIRIHSAGYYNWRCEIHYCPYCGKPIGKYRKGGVGHDV